jgi:hypothetical protein
VQLEKLVFVTTVPVKVPFASGVTAIVPPS